MSLLAVFLQITFGFFILWSVFELSGRKFCETSKNKIFYLVFFTSSGALYLLNGKFGTAMLIETAVALIFVSLARRKNATESLNLINEIILTMTSGLSFDAAMAKLPPKQRESLFQDASFSKILGFCQKNGSLSYKALKFYRNLEKLKSKLKDQEKNISLQAKAQATICFFLYILVFAFQWFWNPDFQKIVMQSGGRAVLVGSFCWLCGGIYFVFKLSKTKSLEI